MPAYWKRRKFTRRYKRKPRYRFLSWRARQAFRRNKWRKFNYRKHRKVKKKRRFKKRTKIIVKQFNPTSMRKCKIIGSKCIIQGSHLRKHHNFIQYFNSKVPEHKPGGGGWSQIIFTLDSLYDDFLKMQNIWTNSNCDLPLARYKGCTLKFYQTENIDYIVVYDTCWPMVDTYLSHADASPTGMLLKKNKIIIPSTVTQKRKKPYKKVFIRPPSQLQTKWYFQKELCKTPLLLLTTTAISLTYPFCSPKSQNNNISLKCLNPFVFQNLNFQGYPKTSGYYCKFAHIESQNRDYPMYLYATANTLTGGQDGVAVTKDNIESYGLIPLAQTTIYQAGSPMDKQSWQNNISNWGNPFHYHNLDEHTHTVYLSLMSPIEAFQLLKGTISKTFYLVKPSGPLIYTVRYNPETDKGFKNKAWMLSTSKTASTNPPEDINLIIDGFPLFVLYWGWTDWIKKAKLFQDADQNSITVFQTDQFDIPLPLYIVVDEDFLEGRDPYTPSDDTSHPTTPSSFSQQHWYPKLQFQDQSIEKICVSGPACTRTSNYMQAFVKYKFHFTWGGCPKKLEKACNPCSQPTWTTPDNLNGRLEITNPNTSPLTELWNWDWQSDFVKTEALQRIQDHTITDQSTFISTANKNIPETSIKKKTHETQEQEEKTLLHQLNQLQQQRQLLQDLLLNRITTS
nr:MAG: ORF1 [TTV-like mini virus]